MGLISSIAQVTDSKSRAKAYLAELFDDGSLDQSSVRSFQYYPETISDSRGVSYSSKDVIGGSHPIYQWTHGSERVITFSAVFTADYSDEQSVGSNLSKINDAVNVIKNPMNAIGAAAKKAFGGSVKDTNSLSVAAAIAWLRSKTYPDYPAGQIMSAPPKLILYLPGSGITSYVGPYKTDGVPVLMRTCSVEYEAFFNNGAPRVAVVSLEFVETIQVGASWGYVSQSDVEASWKTTSVYDQGKGDTILADTKAKDNAVLSLPNLPKISLF
jgi:hypothetical protein